MNYRTLPNTDLRVSTVAMGCWAIAGGNVWGDQSENDAIAAIETSLDLGINLFDTAEGYGEIARTLTGRGKAVWVIGGPDEARLAAEIASAGGPLARDLTGPDLRNAILALAAAKAAVSNDSGLLHVAAALGTPAIGIFGPTSPWHWAPLNPLAAVIETRTEVPCRPCHKPTCRLHHHRCMRDIPAAQVLEAVEQALAA